jgi:hypothetical protein
MTNLEMSASTTRKEAVACARSRSASGMQRRSIPRYLSTCLLAVATSACGSNLRMRVNEPLQVKRGYWIDGTRFYQHGQELDASDVKEKLENHTVSAASVRSGQRSETIASILKAPAFITLLFAIDGLLPNSTIEASQSTTVGLFAASAACFGGSLAFFLASESDYVAAVEQHNARFSPTVFRDGSASTDGPVESQPARDGFPHKVGPYGFGMRMSGAAAVCSEAAQQWRVNGSEAVCVRSDRSRKDALDVRLQFSLGVLTKITVLYKPPSQVLARDYASLAGAFRAKYGKPQIEAPGIPDSCRASLAACLAEGNQVKATVWSWSKGSLELEPVWREEQAQIEVRYLQQEAPDP